MYKQISRDTSSLVQLEKFERPAAKTPEPPASSVCYTGLQRESVINRREPPALPAVPPAGLLTKEPLYRTVPTASVTKTAGTNINFLTLHEVSAMLTFTKRGNI